MRAIDVIVALGMIVVLAPIALFIAAAVAATSRGPVIFRQSRVGYDGKHFEILKFRTMTNGTFDQVLADPETRRRYVENDFKLPGDDPRITRIGKLLRRSSLDELPQLVNVVRGEMGLVGVRPLVPQELALRPRYDQALYCAHRPALTGLWQVEGRSQVGKGERVDLDRRCLETWGVRNNLSILVKTPSKVLAGSGAH